MEESLKKLINQYLEDEDETYEENFSGSVDDNLIFEVESDLQVVMPSDYKAFLKEYGSGGIAGIIVLGIESENDDIQTYSLVSETKNCRREYRFPNSYIVVESGAGYVTCLDTKENEVLLCEPRENGEIIHRRQNFLEYLIDKISYMIE